MRVAFAGIFVVASVATLFGESAGQNVRVTVDNGVNGAYVSADQLAGGTYSDAVLTRCGVDRRMQNEPTLAIDPRNTTVWASGANDYCTVPTAGDAWAGFYRSTDSGRSWTDSLLPGYNGDTSTEGTSSPLHALVAGGALAAGDPVMGFDGPTRTTHRTQPEQSIELPRLGVRVASSQVLGTSELRTVSQHRMSWRRGLLFAVIHLAIAVPLVVQQEARELAAMRNAPLTWTHAENGAGLYRSTTMRLSASLGSEQYHMMNWLMA